MKHTNSNTTLWSIIGIVVVVIIIVIGLILGLRPSDKTERSSLTRNEPTPTTPQPTIENSSQDTKSFTDSAQTFTFIYPSQFIASERNEVTSSWRQEGTASGTILAQVKVPKSYMPSTNFSEATLSIAKSSDTGEVKNCLAAPQGATGTKTMTTLNGTQFTKYTSSDAGAGNLYETTSYRAVKDTTCYAIEYTIHSTNIGNYDPDSGIAPFDRSKIVNQMEGIITTFKFL